MYHDGWALQATDGLNFALRTIRVNDATMVVLHILSSPASAAVSGNRFKMYTMLAAEDAANIEP